MRSRDAKDIAQACLAKAKGARGRLFRCSSQTLEDPFAFGIDKELLSRERCGRLPPILLRIPYVRSRSREAMCVLHLSFLGDVRGAFLEPSAACDIGNRRKKKIRLYLYEIPRKTEVER